MPIKYIYDYETQKLLDEAKKALNKLDAYLTKKLSVYTDSPVSINEHLLKSEERKQLLDTIERIHMTAMPKRIVFVEED